MHVISPSCPSDPSDYTAKDELAIVGGFDSCITEALEADDEQPPPPSTEPPADPTTDAPVPPVTETPSAAARELCPTRTIALLPAFATTIASFWMG